MFAIILAGGKSSRMGTDKASLVVEGETLTQRHIRQLSPQVHGIIISIPFGTTAYNSPHLHIPDERPGCGPLMAIYSCLKKSPAAVNFVIACDIPDINIPLMRHLIEQVHDYDIVVPSFSAGLPEPLFGVYQRSALPHIERRIAAEDYKVSHCFSECRTLVVPVADGSWYRNLNTRVEFEAYTRDRNDPAP